MSSVERVIGFVEKMHRLLDGASRAGKTLLVYGKLLAARIDRLSKSHDREVCELLGDQFEFAPDLVEFSSHGSDGIG